VAPPLEGLHFKCAPIYVPNTDAPASASPCQPENLGERQGSAFKSHPWCTWAENLAHVPVRPPLAAGLVGFEIQKGEIPFFLVFEFSVARRDTFAR
jgi:hypothetical protein